jgi:two-component system chemotaxis response regulator CheB
MSTKKIRVLVADGSVVERDRVVAALRSDPQIEVVGEAAHAVAAVESTKRFRPDVVILGIQLPGSGGSEATREIMIEAPTPVVIVSNQSDERHVKASMLALEAGALAVAPAPQAGDGDPAAVQRLVSTVKSMAGVKVVRRWRLQAAPDRVRLPDTPSQRTTARIVAIAASTGGPAALQKVLSALPVDFAAPILIVQHISSGFVSGLASWLNALCPLAVKTAEDGEALDGNTVYLAPDGSHLGVSKGFRIALSRADPIGGFRPSASYLFESVATAFGAASLHVILTGMGQDGVTGLRTAFGVGARVVAQDEASSVVFGMPAAAIAAGLVHSVVPLESVSAELMAATGRSVLA